jgi:hypothetical protein
MIYGKGGPFGTKSKRRVIPLSPRVQPLIEGHFALRERLEMSVRTIQRVVRVIANRAQISRKVTPHVLRHTFSVTAVQKGISLPALQRLLGHDHLATTEIYLNLSPEHVIQSSTRSGEPPALYAAHDGSRSRFSGGRNTQECEERLLVSQGSAGSEEDQLVVAKGAP